MISGQNRSGNSDPRAVLDPLPYRNVAPPSIKPFWLPLAHYFHVHVSHESWPVAGDHPELRINRNPRFEVTHLLLPSRYGTGGSGSSHCDPTATFGSCRFRTHAGAQATRRR